MKKTLHITGLDCANCAAKVERAINKLDEVESATLNFMTGKLSIEAAEDKMEAVIAAALAAAKKVEPDVVIK